jgi:Domain of unknown function (DUF4352)
MAQQEGYPRGRGPGYTNAAGFEPSGQGPRMRPPATPEQWQGRVPQGAPPTGQPQYPPRPDPQPAFTPDPWQDSQSPGGQYPPPQPAWQQPYRPQPQYAPGPQPRRKRHTVRNVLAGIGALIAVIIVISVAENSGHTVQTTGSAAGAGSHGGAATKTAGIGSAITLSGNSSGEQMSVTVTKVIGSASPSDSFNTAPSGDRLYAVQFRLKDTGSAAYSDSPSNGAAVVDSSGQSYQSGLETVSECQGFGGTENIAPGSSGLGCIVFEVPKAAKIAKVQFTLDSGFGPQTGQWDVG